jgi:hypothetical protein
MGRLPARWAGESLLHQDRVSARLTGLRQVSGKRLSLGATIRREVDRPHRENAAITCIAGCK